MNREIPWDGRPSGLASENPVFTSSFHNNIPLFRPKQVLPQNVAKFWINLPNFGGHFKKSFQKVDLATLKAR
jgi:hypothetical protein